MNKQAFRRVFLDTVPVMTGYLFLGTGFGVLLTESGHGLPWALCMSLFVYAGSAQYLLVSLMASGTGLLSTAIATLLLNARHLFYGITLVDTYRGAGKKKPYLIFALTDETYSLVTQNTPPQGMTQHGYCFWVSVFNHIYWVTGSVLGSVVGKFLPFNFEGIEFVLTALFVTLFVEQWLTAKSRFSAVVGVVATALCLLLFGKDVFLIPSMALIALTLTIARKTGRRAADA